MLRIGCTKINGKQFLLSRSSPHINNKEQSTKCCKRAIEAHENQDKNHKNDAGEMNLEEWVGSLYNRTHGMFWKYQDILLDLREKIGKK